MTANRNQPIKVLAVVSLPPPATGQAVASEKLVTSLSGVFRFRVVNTSKERLKQGVDSFKRVVEVAQILAAVFRGSRKCDIAYLILSQSRAGNIRDLCILAFIPPRVPVVVHLHGGGLGRNLYSKHAAIRVLNRWAFASRHTTAVVLGESLKDQFRGVLPNESVRVVYNFAEDIFFEPPGSIAKKFRRDPLEIVFLSNMLPGKGHMELLDAAIDLGERGYGGKFTVSFIGRFDDRQNEERFRQKIERTAGARYYGPIEGTQRAEFLRRAHIFCLPTYYRYEGQPLAILEAYAAGCFVVTTHHGGISDVFVDGVNGFLVRERSVESLAAALIRIMNTPRSRVESTARANSTLAREQFRETRFSGEMDRIFRDSFAVTRVGAGRT